MITNPASSCLRRTKGVALVTVLALLVLITALIVGFLARVGTEGVASSNYTGTATTRFLADTAVNVVQAQINEATMLPATSTWASQPGAIRVFDQNGSLSKIYRLYSAATLSPDATDGDVLANDVPQPEWADSPALWTDLNAPVRVIGMKDASGQKQDDYLVFPILDPRDPTDTSSTLEKPGVTTKLPGFSITGAPGVTDQQPAPMPVRWLYVLEDGRIVAPTGIGKTATIAGATKQNPIVGRIAFWTDDEAAKVNINTAAGSLRDLGSGNTKAAPWETPRFAGTDEKNIFASNQPIHLEYQRYPGHPATTLLYPLLNGLGVTLTPYPGAEEETSGLFKLLPRYNDDNGSKSGTVDTTKTNAPKPMTVKQTANGNTPRLYTSIGELLYDPERALSTVSRQQVESGKFFLTAQSRAPELNLFGKPRVAIWPVDKDQTSNRVTPFDKLIAFCATTGGTADPKRYFFQRRNSWSPTDDFDANLIPRNPELYGYLQRLTRDPVPGFGGTFEAKYGTAERDQILTEIVDYIRSTNVYDYSMKSLEKEKKEPIGSRPRFTPAKGNGSGSGQVVPLEITTNGRLTRGIGRTYTLSEIGVHLICTAEGSTTAHENITTGLSSTGYQTPVEISGKLVSPAKGSAHDPQYVSNLPVPQFLRDNSGNIVGWDSTTLAYNGDSTTELPDPGFNEFPANKTLVDTYDKTPKAGDELAPGEKRVQAILLMETHCPMLGYAQIYPAFQVNVSGLNGISIGGETPFTTTSGTVVARWDNATGSGIGGVNGFRALLKGRKNRWTNPGPNAYPFVSDPFTVSSGGNATISGSCTITVDALPNTGGTVLLQTFNVNFPEATASVPAPDLIRFGIRRTGSPIDTIPSDFWGYDVRFTYISSTSIWGGAGGDKNYQGLNSFFRVDPASTSNPTPSPPDIVKTPWQLGNRYQSIKIPLNNTQYNPFGGGNKPYSGTWPGVPSDVVRSLIAKDGDVRLIAAKATIAASDGPASDFAKQTGYDSGAKLAHSFMEGSDSHTLAGTDLGGKLGPLGSGISYGTASGPDVPSTFTYPYADPGPFRGPQTSWDWDNGLPGTADGSFANKPDEGNTYIGTNSTPYFNSPQEAGDATSYFTANRIIPSPVMFGSLPTGVASGVPWRTLLFRPHANRPAWADPLGTNNARLKDHLLLDLFWMPVVEPYAISEPFSTAGKINMNYQIVPFKYISRSTGLRAVLGSELIAKVPDIYARPNSNNEYPARYKSVGSASERLSVDLDETLKQFESRFDDWEIFKSATEICDIYLIPEGYQIPQNYSWTDNSALDAIWYGADFALVGDNVRERPYADIYPRLTTKSNTFTVHYTVQSLKNPSADPSQWTEGRGAVTGEYRGSTTIERFLDPNNGTIRDYATIDNLPSMDTLYQWRVVANNAFAP